MDDEQEWVLIARREIHQGPEIPMGHSVPVVRKAAAQQRISELERERDRALAERDGNAKQIAQQVHNKRETRSHLTERAEKAEARCTQLEGQIRDLPSRCVVVSDLGNRGELRRTLERLSDSMLAAVDNPEEKQ